MLTSLGQFDETRGRIESYDMGRKKAKAWRPKPPLKDSENTLPAASTSNSNPIRKDTSQRTEITVDLPTDCRRKAPGVKALLHHWLGLEIPKIESAHQVTVSSHVILDEAVRFFCTPVSEGEKQDQGKYTKHSTDL